ncbi:HAMP domain-containing sensor histidine kinase [Candidatus Formimonas warabiya]|uniref:histidine kinase n=1 Tax=Formimonas warabiya TaxID=1761012 RepID=A0A3G1L060_FORW1|nr:ATP-binding protein [Candidatus Formimonas warabiya]ATW28047.1 two-component sensor histidine kinase [Candidatus Formimonas warabiya]
MKYSLKAKLSFSYVMVALISILLISVLTNQFLEKQFREYVQQNQEQKNHTVAVSIRQQYLGEEKWNYAAVESIGINALENGLIIKVTDASGEVIWDAKIHNNGMCQRIIRQMSQNMNTHYPNLKGGYVEKPYPIIVDDKEVGLLNIGYYGPFYLTENDLAFINTLNKLNVAAGLLAMLFALLLGLVMAKRLSTPISRVIDAAQMISRGYFGGRISEKSSTQEICQLTESVNHMAQNLENQEILRKRLTADVAHELRTPLATLRSHLEAMIDGIWQADCDRLQSCHEEIMRITRMVGDLEMLARYDNENLTLNKTQFDLSGLAKQVVQNFESAYVKKGVTLNYSGGEEGIRADKDKMNQVLSNLLSNALKYTPAGGQVDVSVKGTLHTVEVIVKDNGTGIAEDDLPFIYERFYRADKSRTRLTGGSGIGLTITRSIVEAHKGKIEVGSKLNEGSEFRVILPRQADE